MLKHVGEKNRILRIAISLMRARRPLVKHAFARCDVALDYISQEVLRRWTKYLGVANFSYHVPRHNALRLWSTASIHESDEGIAVNRRIGPEMVQKAMEQMPAAYGEVRRRDRSSSLWVPIHQVRSGVCWSLESARWSI